METSEEILGRKTTTDVTQTLIVIEERRIAQPINDRDTDTTDTTRVTGTTVRVPNELEVTQTDTSPPRTILL